MWTNIIAVSFCVLIVVVPWAFIIKRRWAKPEYEAKLRAEAEARPPLTPRDWVLGGVWILVQVVVVFVVVLLLTKYV